VGRVQEGRIRLRCGVLQDLIAGQDKLSHQIHQLVQQTRIDSDIAVREGGRARFRLYLQCLIHHGRFGEATFHQNLTEWTAVAALFHLQGHVDLLRTGSAAFSPSGKPGSAFSGSGGNSSATAADGGVGGRGETTGA